MKRLIIVLFLIFTSLAYAEEYIGRVSLEKSTGKLIEYQNKGVIHKGLISTAIGKPFKELTKEEIARGIEIVNQRRLDTLRQNALNSGYKEEDIEVKFVTKKEWKRISDKWINKPAIEQKIKEKKKKEAKEKSLKEKFGWTDQDLKDLKEILK